MNIPFSVTNESETLVCYVHVYVYISVHQHYMKQNFSCMKDIVA